MGIFIGSDNYRSTLVHYFSVQQSSEALLFYKTFLQNGPMAIHT